MEGGQGLTGQHHLLREIEATKGSNVQIISKQQLSTEG
jgi:hypothetical protein